MIKKGDHVCFVTPPVKGKYIIRDYAGGLGFEATYDKNLSYVLPPLDFLQFASCISDKFQVSLIDAQDKNLSIDALLRQINCLKAQIIIVEISIPTIDTDLECADHFQSLNIPVIGKVHTHDKSILKRIFDSSAIELCIIGEVEDNLANILLGKDLRGTAIAKDDQIRITKKEFISDLNTLPFPARNLVSQGNYFYPKLGKCTTILTSRGCPYSCSYYCPYPLVQGRKWRTKSSSYVLEEITNALSYGLNRFLFRDPIFSLQEKRTTEIAKGIINLNQDISWWCETRADRLSEDLVSLMGKSGCKGINVGVESGDPNLRYAYLKQGVSDEVLENLSIWCKESRINLAFLLMVGFPGETRISIVATAELLRKCRPGSIGISFPVHHPGTQFNKEALDKGWIIQDRYEATDGSSPVLQGPYLSASEMIEAKNLLLQLFEAISNNNSKLEISIFQSIKKWSIIKK